MALILCIETATDVCSVALNKEGNTIGLQTFHLPRAHNQVLSTSITHVMQTTNHELSQLNAIAVSTGPGSYTGLRIGLAMGKGLCYALDLPLIAINTLVSLAESVQTYHPQACWLCPTLDARGAGIYWSIVDPHVRSASPARRGWITKPQLDVFCPEGALYVFGSGVEKSASALMERPDTHFLQGVVPTAASMGRIAQKKFRQEAFENVIDCDPMYLQ